MGEEFKAHRAALAEMGQRATGHALERAQQEGVDAAVDVVSAKPAEALLRVAEECDARLIVVGTSGRARSGARCWARPRTSSCSSARSPCLRAARG